MSRGFEFFMHDSQVSYELKMTVFLLFRKIVLLWSYLDVKCDLPKNNRFGGKPAAALV